MTRVLVVEDSTRHPEETLAMRQALEAKGFEVLMGESPLDSARPDLERLERFVGEMAKIEPTTACEQIQAEVLAPMVNRVKAAVVQHLVANTARTTRYRHGEQRTLPPRGPQDVLDRIEARNAKLARRAAAARKAGLL